MMRAPGATPITPAPSSAAAIVPATCVPWPWASCGSASSSTKSQPGTMRPANSGWPASMPVSTTATVDAGAARDRPRLGRVDVGVATPRCHQTDWPVLCRPHWRPASASAESRRGWLGSAHADIRVGAQRREGRAAVAVRADHLDVGERQVALGGDARAGALGAGQPAVAQHDDLVGHGGVRPRGRGSAAPGASAARQRTTRRRAMAHRNRPSLREMERVRTDSPGRRAALQGQFSDGSGGIVDRSANSRPLRRSTAAHRPSGSSLNSSARRGSSTIQDSSASSASSWPGPQPACPA